MAGDPIARTDLSEQVAGLLRSNGLTPGVDEYKSGAFMSAKPSMAKVREELLDLTAACTRIAALFCPFSPSTPLGDEGLYALDVILRRNGLSRNRVAAYWDRGLFRSSQRLSKVLDARPGLRDVELWPEQDSRTCLGIQLADLVAHSLARLLRARLTGVSKTVRLGGIDAGYPVDEAELGWLLRWTLRRSFFARPVVNAGDEFDPDTEPVILGPQDDPVAAHQYRELLGWGVQMTAQMDGGLRTAVEETFGYVWLGCML